MSCFIQRRSARSVFFAGLAALVVFIFGLPSVSYADNKTPPPEKKTVEYSYSSTDVKPDIPSTITENGQELKLKSVGEWKADTTYQAAKLPFSYSFVRQISLEQGMNPAAAVPPYRAIDETIDGVRYVGSIPLTSWPTAIITESRSRQVEKPYMIPGGLSSNDINALSAYESMDFTTSSDAYVGATTTQSLNRAEVYPFPVAFDASGVAIEYGANLVFRGVENYRENVAYEATYTYSGEVQGDTERFVCTAEYEQEPPAAEPYVEPEPEPFDIRPLVAGLAGIAGAGGIGIFAFFFIRRKPCLYEGERKVEKLTVEKGSLTDRIEIKTDVLDNPSAYSVRSTKHYAKREQVLEIAFNQDLVYSGGWKQVINFDFAEDLEGKVEL